jgi:membrane protein DedA with SNARE-associated domain
LPTEDLILSLIEQYGWSIVFFGVMIQSARIPLPAQTVLIVSGFLVQQGHLKLWEVILFATMGTVLGGPTGYWVSHKVGRPLVLRWGRYALITPSRLQRAEKKFLERYGWVSYITNPLCARYQAVWRALGRYKPDALENLSLLQRYRRGCLDNGYDLSGLLPGRLPVRLNATL